MKKTKTAHGETMLFGHFYDLQGDLLDTVHFPPSAKRYPFHGIGVYELQGCVTEAFGYFTLEVAFLRKINYIPDVRYEESSKNKKAAS